MYLLFVLFFTACSTPTLVYSLYGTLSPYNRPEHKFCLLNSNTIAVRHFNDDNCEPIMFNVHKHNNNLVLNFKTRNKYLCNYLCINKCGEVYHESVFYTEDCLLTTSALEHIETLSVYRGNYSDFFAANEYYLTALSMQPGDSVQRQQNMLALKFQEIDKLELCPLMLEPSKLTRDCYTPETRDDHNKYINRKHYRDYSFWGKLLIFLGVTEYFVPTNETQLSYIEYNTKL
ncbi:fgf-1 [Psilogramma increta granulovirus]|uniref:Fgf-1 n=1 Tax=Psilogramma increta granulovirus TaxID=2953508 RepID=A0A977XU61_9BBAC|nr:fgf-1 [Psilogramma increta granulovirus]